MGLFSAAVSCFLFIPRLHCTWQPLCSSLSTLSSCCMLGLTRRCLTGMAIHLPTWPWWTTLWRLCALSSSTCGQGSQRPILSQNWTTWTLMVSEAQRMVISVLQGTSSYKMHPPNFHKIKRKKNPQMRLSWVKDASFIWLEHGMRLPETSSVRSISDIVADNLSPAQFLSATRLG